MSLTVAGFKVDFNPSISVFSIEIKLIRHL